MVFVPFFMLSVNTEVSLKFGMNAVPLIRYHLMGKLAGPLDGCVGLLHVSLA